MEVYKEGRNGDTEAYGEFSQLLGLILKRTEQKAVLVLLDAHKELQKVYQPAGKEKTAGKKIEEACDPPAQSEAMDAKHAAIQAQTKNVLGITL